MIFASNIDRKILTNIWSVSFLAVSTMNVLTKENTQKSDNYNVTSHPSYTSGCYEQCIQKIKQHETLTTVSLTVAFKPMCYKKHSATKTVAKQPFEVIKAMPVIILSA